MVSYNYNRLERAGNKLDLIIVADPRICRCEKIRPLKGQRVLDEAFGNEREIVREPSVDPAFERADPVDSFGSQQQRHTGAWKDEGLARSQTRWERIEPEPKIRKWFQDLSRLST